MTHTNKTMSSRDITDSWPRSYRVELPDGHAYVARALQSTYRVDTQNIPDAMKALLDQLDTRSASDKSE